MRISDLSSDVCSSGLDIAITITDNGHGMSPDDVEKKFLPINRKRRLDANGTESNVRSESGLRHVMGRKGLGKLAGFGAATKVVIRTKQIGRASCRESVCQ